jgi:hypothetical protein
LTELVIVTPLFILLIFWSEFFTDLGILTLKVEEATRYAEWEMAAQRDPGSVATEIKQRFAGLRSPSSYTGVRPETRSFTSVRIPTVTITTNGAAPFEGSLPPAQLRAGSGLLGAILGALSHFLSNTTTSLLNRLSFNTNREAQSIVEFDATNTLFPGGSMFHIFFDASTNTPFPALNVAVRRTSPLLLVDTWKAWPGPYGQTPTTTETDVKKTYVTNGANAVEQELSHRIAKMAFFDYLTGFLGGVDSVLGFFGIAQPFSTSPWKSDSGPITAMEGKEPKHTWQPGTGAPSQRLGDLVVANSSPQYAQGLRYVFSPGTPQPPGDPQKAVDRYRFSVPSEFNSVFWTGVGGMDNSTMQGTKILAPTSNAPSSAPYGYPNPYPKLYDCRDGYYMGGTQPQVQHYNNAHYYERLFPTCE